METSFSVSFFARRDGGLTSSNSISNALSSFAGTVVGTCFNSIMPKRFIDGWAERKFRSPFLF
jgi:hypothetical protein